MYSGPNELSLGDFDPAGVPLSSFPSSATNITGEQGSQNSSSACSAGMGNFNTSSRQDPGSGPGVNEAGRAVRTRTVFTKNRLLSSHFNIIYEGEREIAGRRRRREPNPMAEDIEGDRPSHSPERKRGPVVANRHVQVCESMNQDSVSPRSSSSCSTSWEAWEYNDSLGRESICGASPTKSNSKSASRASASYDRMSQD